MITTVVMTRDRRDDLLASLAHHQGPVVVVDNGSRDGTLEALEALRRPDLTVIALPANAGAPARNIGVRAASTAYVAFADDDSWWAPGALATAERVLDEHPRLALLAGRLLVGPDERTDPVCEQLAAAPLGQAPDLPGPDVLGFMACGVVVRRDAFLACGGFDPVVFFPGEEERLALDLAAAGWGLAYVPEVVAHHHPSVGARHDSGARAAVITRNHLLTAVMRRPWPVVLRRAVDGWRAGGPRRRGVLQALPRASRALAERTRLPADVERRARLLERPADAHGRGTHRVAQPATVSAAPGGDR